MDTWDWDQVAPEYTAPPNIFGEIPWVEDIRSDPFELLDDFHDMLNIRDALIAKHTKIIHDKLAERNAQLAEHLHVNMHVNISAENESMRAEQRNNKRMEQFAQLHALFWKSKYQRAEADIRLKGLDELSKMLDELDQAEEGSSQSLGSAEQAAKKAERDELLALQAIRTQELAALVEEGKEASAEMGRRIDEVFDQVSHQSKLIEKLVQIDLVLKKFQG